MFSLLRHGDPWKLLEQEGALVTAMVKEEESDSGWRQLVGGGWQVGWKLHS